MACIEFDTKSETYRVRFRYPRPIGPKQKLRVDPRIKGYAMAQSLADDVEESITLVGKGTGEVPPGVELADFISYMGELPAEQCAASPAHVKQLGELSDAYLAEKSKSKDHENSLLTTRIHVMHLSNPELHASAG